MNCNNCNHFNTDMFFADGRCLKTGYQLSICEHFKDFKEERLKELMEEYKEDNKIQSDWVYYLELVNSSVGINCPL